MKHLIFGSGLIGSFVGGGLSDADFDVSFLARQNQIEALKSGFSISALNGTILELSGPKFINDTKAETFDVVWLTVKCTAVEKSINQLRQHLDDKSVIVCCQNGFGSDAVLRSALPDTIILNATIGFNVAEQNSRHFHRSTDGSLVIEKHDRITPVVKAINQEVLPTNITTNINSERWAKLQLNLANPVNALANIPTKAMTEDREYRVVIAALMSELLQVTDAIGLSLPKLTALPAKWLPSLLKLPDFIYLRLAQKTLAIDPTARVSMWWDLSHNKKTEIDFLNGAVVNKALELGIKCPVNKRIIKLIKEVENGQRQIGLSGKNLQHLLGLQV